jgi:arsenite methyltransferase
VGRMANDMWSDWLLRGRHGGDPVIEPVIRNAVNRYRDRVLDGADLSTGMRLVDVGAGDGLVAFGAIERVGSSLQVIFVDISKPLLTEAEKLAVERGVRAQCSFLHASAESLAGIADGSVDAVTTRAALAYVVNKGAAVREFYRVLKPGGRVSLAEPIFQDAALQLAALTSFLATRPLDEKAVSLWRLMQRCKAEQLPATKAAIVTDPLTAFCERDLIILCQKAGFVEMHLELHIDIVKTPACLWATYVDISPHPGAPTLREIFRTKFTAREKRELETAIRPRVEAGELLSREATAYLVAGKPEPL